MYHSLLLLIMLMSFAAGSSALRGRSLLVLLVFLFGVVRVLGLLPLSTISFEWMISHAFLLAGSVLLAQWCVLVDTTTCIQQGMGLEVLHRALHCSTMEHPVANATRLSVFTKRNLDGEGRFTINGRDYFELVLITNV